MLTGLVDPGIDSRIEGGPQLAALSLASIDQIDGSALLDVSEVLGPRGAVTAACVAGAFQMTNRVVEACGVPVPREQFRRARTQLEQLGLDLEKTT